MLLYSSTQLQDYGDCKDISFLAAIGLGSDWMLPKRLTLLHPGPFGSVEIWTCAKLMAVPLQSQ